MMSVGPAALPSWAIDLLASPGTLLPITQQDGSLIASDGQAVGSVVGGVACFPTNADDSNIEFYREVGGAHFFERASVAYSMSALDTTVYCEYLAQLRCDDLNAVIVDVGGGDGRNAMPWLRWGFQRIVLIDPARAALARLRARLAANNPEWLDRVLLIEAEARQLPLRDRCADRVQSIESLAYLNDDYAQGLAECERVMAAGGRILVSDRDYEGGLLTRLFYGGGINGMLQQAGTRAILDGNDQRRVSSRCYTGEEFAAMIRSQGLRILSHSGISVLSLILGYERGGGRLLPNDEAHLAAVHALLGELAHTGAMRRSHVIVAEREI
jgi:ubiquinone/menaquinone biosynthesis C-methylase UbiE